MKNFTLIIIFHILLLFSNNLFSNTTQKNTKNSLIAQLNRSKNIEDSLIAQLNSSKDIENNITHYINLIQFYQTNNLSKSIEYCDIAIDICNKNSLKVLEIEVCIEKYRSLIKTSLFSNAAILSKYIEEQLNTLDKNSLWGRYYLAKTTECIQIGDLSKAMENAYEALAFLEISNDSLHIARTYNIIGVIYDLTNNYKKALDNYLLSKEYATKIKNNQLLSYLNNNIGIIYSILGDDNTALNYYFKALEYYIQHDIHSASTSYNNIALSLITLDRYNEAMAYSHKALYIAKSAQDISSIALLYSNIGNIFKHIGKLDSANFYIDQSLIIYSQIKDTYESTESLILKGEVLLLQKKYDQSIKSFKKSIDLSKKTGVLSSQEIALKSISQIYSELKEYKTAIKYYQLAYSITDSISIINKKEELNFADFRIVFQNQSNEYFNKIKDINTTHKIELNKEKNRKYIFILLFLSIIIVSLYLFNKSKKSKKINKKLLLQNNEIEKQKELIKISNIELKEQYAFIETLLNTIPNPVYYTDKNSNLLGCNNAFESMSGNNIENLIGFKTDRLNLKTTLPCSGLEIIQSSNRELVRNEGVITFNDNTIHEVILYKKGISDPSGKITGILGIFIDITDIKNTQNKLESSEALLKKTIKSKDKFFKIIAHDLKNPFNAILGLTSIIDNDFDTISQTDLKQYAKLINQSTNNLYSLLENLLEWASSQSSTIKINTTTFKINELVNESAELFKQTLNQKNIVLNFSNKDNFEVVADKNMILTVLRNLLSNAIKYTNKSGQIDITIQENDTLTRVTVTDNGIGINPKVLDRLFKIDEQISTLGVENEKGTGLGLIICQEFISKNGGTIDVTSQLGSGSSFSFTIPSK